MFANRVSQRLHEEHRSTIALMERLEGLIARHGRARVPDARDRTVAQLLSDLSAEVESEVKRHFDFEEEKLFPYLEAAGDGAIGAHLADEHSAMRPLGLRLAALARDCAANGFDEEKWSEFRKGGQELCERMLAHVQKEEMALLMLLDETLDADTEESLYREYVETQ